MHDYYFVYDLHVAWHKLSSCLQFRVDSIINFYRFKQVKEQANFYIPSMVDDILTVKTNFINEKMLMI